MNYTEDYCLKWVTLYSKSSLNSDETLPWVSKIHTMHDKHCVHVPFQKSRLKQKNKVMKFFAKGNQSIKIPAYIVLVWKYFLSCTSMRHFICLLNVYIFICHNFINTRVLLNVQLVRVIGVLHSKYTVVVGNSFCMSQVVTKF